MGRGPSDLYISHVVDGSDLEKDNVSKARP